MINNDTLFTKAISVSLGAMFESLSPLLHVSTLLEVYNCTCKGNDAQSLVIYNWEGEIGGGGGGGHGPSPLSITQGKIFQWGDFCTFSRGSIDPLLLVYTSSASYNQSRAFISTTLC